MKIIGSIPSLMWQNTDGTIEAVPLDELPIDSRRLPGMVSALPKAEPGVKRELMLWDLTTPGSGWFRVACWFRDGGLWHVLTHDQRVVCKPELKAPRGAEIVRVRNEKLFGMLRLMGRTVCPDCVLGVVSATTRSIASVLGTGGVASMVDREDNGAPVPVTPPGAIINGDWTVIRFAEPPSWTMSPWHVKHAVRTSSGHARTYCGDAPPSLPEGWTEQDAPVDYMTVEQMKLEEPAVWMSGKVAGPGEWEMMCPNCHMIATDPQVIEGASPDKISAVIATTIANWERRDRDNAKTIADLRDTLQQSANTVQKLSDTVGSLQMLANDRDDLIELLQGELEGIKTGVLQGVRDYAGLFTHVIEMGDVGTGFLMALARSMQLPLRQEGAIQGLIGRVASRVHTIEAQYSKRQNAVTVPTGSKPGSFTVQSSPKTSWQSEPPVMTTGPINPPANPDAEGSSPRGNRFGG